MIVTVTPNPAVDRTVFVDALRLGTITHGARSWSEPAARASTSPSRSRPTSGPPWPCCPSAARRARTSWRCWSGPGLDYQAVAIAGEVRVNISIVQPDGVVTKINERGPALSDAEGDALLAAAHTQARAGGWVAGCGSLPGGLADGFYARLVETGHRAGARVVIDTSGAPLVAALAAGPDLIKPNADELADAVGGAVTTVGDVVDAAQELRARGAKAVLASLGGDGAVLVTAAGVVHGTAPVEKVVSTVGAGDALLAGYLSAADDNGLEVALAWGAAAVQHHGTLFTTAQHPAHVAISEHVPSGRELSH